MGNEKDEVSMDFTKRMQYLMIECVKRKSPVLGWKACMSGPISKPFEISHGNRI